MFLYTEIVPYICTADHDLTKPLTIIILFFTHHKPRRLVLWKFEWKEVTHPFPCPDNVEDHSNWSVLSSLNSNTVQAESWPGSLGHSWGRSQTQETALCRLTWLLFGWGCDRLGTGWSFANCLAAGVRKTQSQGNKAWWQIEGRGQAESWDPS